MSGQETVSREVPQPGEFPYTAGIHPTGYKTRLWTMRQLAGLGDTKSTNERFRYLLGLGETGLSLAFDLPTQMGLDPDDPAAAGEVGRVGVSICTADDLAAVFEGIPLDEVSVAMTINATAPMLLAMWIVVAEESGVDPAGLRGTIQNEMLKEFLARNAYMFALDESFRFSLDVIEHCVQYLPQVRPISVSGGHAREAGASRDLEVACAVADAEEYLQGAVERGLDPDLVASSFSFIFGTHVEVLREAAKLRAARRLYARRMAERWQVSEPRALKMRIQVNTFGSALAHQEPLNNVARVTLQAVAAVLGGVQSLHTCGFDEAHRTPSQLAARVALRTQQIIAHESDLARDVDPLGGSPVFERLTDEIEEGAEAWLERIEDRGGMLSCLRSGWLEGQLDDLAFSDREPKVGVEDPSRSSAEDRALEDGSARSPVSDTPRAIRRSENLPELECLQEAVRKEQNVIPPLIDAARARATIGQMRTAMEVNE
jgi:methylmalonyl-CoA mutase N-terminal domain/subunit